MVLMIPTKVIKAIFQENVFFMEIWVSRCIDQCLAVLPGHGTVIREGLNLGAFMIFNIAS